MARCDYHVTKAGFLLDCQADLLSHLKTRFVVPLLPRQNAPLIAARLNPVFPIAGGEYVMATQFAASILARDLGPVAGTLAPHDRTIMDALDMLLTGF